MHKTKTDHSSYAPTSPSNAPFGKTAVVGGHVPLGRVARRSPLNYADHFCDQLGLLTNWLKHSPGEEHLRPLKGSGFDEKPDTCSMHHTRLAQQLAFLHEIDKLKYILRKTCLFHSERRENDAEHSWHLCLMALTLQEYSPEPVDLLKVMKMLLIHDLVEIDAGDTFLYDAGRQSEAHAAAEEAAAQRIFGLLPAEQGAEMYALWREFESADNADTRFARAIDRLQPVLQNLTNGGGTWKEHQISAELIFEKVAGIAKGTPALWAYIQHAIPAAAQNGSIELGQ